MVTILTREIRQQVKEDKEISDALDAIMQGYSKRIDGIEMRTRIERASNLVRELQFSYGRDIYFAYLNVYDAVLDSLKRDSR